MSTFLFFLLFYLAADVHSYFSLRSLVGGRKGQWIYGICFFLLSVFALYCLYEIWSIARSRSMFSGTVVNFYLGSFLSIFVLKVALSFFMLFQDVPRVFKGLYNFGKSIFDGSKKSTYLPGRRKSFTQLAAGLASLPFLTMLYGVTKGKYRYTLKRLSISLKNLPKEFDGYRIVQISDIHAGSFDSIPEVARGVEMINDLDADAFFFTGDLVNSDKNEIDPYIETFSKIKAKDGKFAVLGNHDYYGLYDLKENEKEAYWNDFYAKYKGLDFDLLNNENRTIVKNGQELKIVGVENWGAGRWFPKEGDLEVALEGVKDEDCCILLSHDPTHWEQKVLQHQKKIDLTLSGHTHGFQFGISMPGFKWSPAQYRYKRWIGLHEEEDQYLYINRGYGFLAFPGRVGMWPEITLIELKSA